MLTKSGTNTLRGSAYEFSPQRCARRRATTSTSPASRTSRAISSAAPSAARWSQDRLFYFVGYEALRENLGKTISSFVPDDNARAGLLPDGPVTISRRRPAVPRRDSARQRAVDRSRAGDAHLRLRPDARPGLLPGARRLSARRRASVLRPLHLRRRAAGLPTDYPQFPRSFISTNQFATVEYRNVLSARTLQTARFGYSRTRIGQNVEANLDVAAAAVRRRPRAGRRHRHRRHAAVRSAELGEPAARAERLQRPVRPDARARRATCSRPASSPSTIATS